MVDLVGEKRDGSQKSTQSNPTTPKRIERTVAEGTHGLGYLGQQPFESASGAETTSKERTQGREPPNYHSQEPYKKRETIHDEHISGMAQSNYGTLLPSTSLGGVAIGHIQHMNQSATHRLGSRTKPIGTGNESPQNIDRSARGLVEPATGYQGFFDQRRLERNRPTNPVLGNPTRARYTANEHPQRKPWPDGFPLALPMEHRQMLAQPRENEYQSPYSYHRPHIGHHDIPNEIPERISPSVNNSTEFLMRYQPAGPYSGPPPRMYYIPNVTPRVISSATNIVERPVAYQPAYPPPGLPPRIFVIPEVTPRLNPSGTDLVERPTEYQSVNPPPGTPTIPRQIVNEGPQRIAAAANLALESPTSPHTVANERLQSMDHSANISSSRTVAAGTIPPPLPPSVEEAYKKKCIELKRRMQEVEESNDVFRVRKARLARGIRKMRLERAYLLEMLGKRMKKNGSSVDGFPQPYDEESDGSSEGPPTVSFTSSSPSRPSRLKSLTNALTL